MNNNNAQNVVCRRRGVDTRSAFDMYDLSKTGFVSRRDFREAMRKLQVLLCVCMYECMYQTKVM